MHTVRNEKHKQLVLDLLFGSKTPNLNNNKITSRVSLHAQQEEDELDDDELNDDEDGIGVDGVGVDGGEEKEEDDDKNVYFNGHSSAIHHQDMYEMMTLTRYKNLINEGLLDQDLNEEEFADDDEEENKIIEQMKDDERQRRMSLRNPILEKWEELENCNSWVDPRKMMKIKSSLLKIDLIWPVHDM